MISLSGCGTHLDWVIKKSNRAWSGRKGLNIGMLLAALRNSGIRVDTDCGFAINVARDLKLCCFPHDASPLFLRVLPQTKGDRDLAHLQALKELLGDHINGPLRVIRGGDLVCGVFPFVQHERVTHEAMQSPRVLAQVRDILARLHSGGPAQHVEGHTLSPVEVASAVRGQSDPTGFFREYFEENFLPVVEHLSPVPQHCDFTYVNLASTRGNQLVVFDWEDYGLVRYPGFDLATFLISHYHHGRCLEPLVASPEILNDMLVRDFGEDFLAALGLTRERFARVFPGYLAVFLTLKRNGFGVRINDRIHGLLLSILRSASWQPVLERRGD